MAAQPFPMSMLSSVTLHKEWAAVHGNTSPKKKLGLKTAASRVKLGVATARAHKRDLKKDEEEMKLCFNAMDGDGDGVLDLVELQKAYNESGVEVTLDMLRQLVRLCRSSQTDSQAGKKPQQQQEENLDAVTFKDFKSLLTLRNVPKWESHGGGQTALTSTDDLPVHLSVVAFTHRRKRIIEAYLEHNFDMSSRFEGNASTAARRASLADEDGTLWTPRPVKDATLAELTKKAVSVLPPRMKAAAAHAAGMPELVKATATPNVAELPGTMLGPRALHRTTFHEACGAQEVALSAPCGSHLFAGETREKPEPRGEGFLEPGRRAITVPMLVRHEGGAMGRHLGTNISCIDPMLPCIPMKSTARRRPRPRHWSNATATNSIRLPDLFPPGLIGSVISSLQPVPPRVRASAPGILNAASAVFPAAGSLPLAEVSGKGIWRETTPLSFLEQSGRVGQMRSAEATLRRRT